MANLVHWIESASADEKILGVVIGGYVPHPSMEGKDFQMGKLLSWEIARPLLDFKFFDGFGIAGCPPVYVWTDSKVFLISEYDGAVSLCGVPRSPTDVVPVYSGEESLI